MTMPSNAANSNVQKISDSTRVAQSTTDVILYTGLIENKGYIQLVQSCERTKSEKVILILNTVGGDPHAGYKIAKYLQSKYSNFTLFISCMCKSAGTLIAVGANELIFAEGGELGPLDVQLRKDHELGGEYRSGLDMINALDYLNTKTLETYVKFLTDFRFGGQLATKTAAAMATPLVTALYESLYRQIDPITLGDITRSMQIASAYGVRLERAGKNLKDNALAKLISGYPSHSFVIDFDEAKEIFKNVRKCNQEEAQIGAAVASGHLDKVAQSPPAVLLLPQQPLVQPSSEVSQKVPVEQCGPTQPQQPGSTTESVGTSAATESSEPEKPNGGQHDLPAHPTAKHRSSRARNSDGDQKQPKKEK